MPTRFFSAEQRARYAKYDGELSVDDLARCFHFDETDRKIIAQLRGSHNRVDFALQLGTLRFLGVFPNKPANIPQSVISWVAQEIEEATIPNLVSYWAGRQHDCLLELALYSKNRGDA